MGRAIPRATTGLEKESEASAEVERIAFRIIVVESCNG